MRAREAGRRPAVMPRSPAWLLYLVALFFLACGSTEPGGSTLTSTPSTLTVTPAPAATPAATASTPEPAASPSASPIPAAAQPAVQPTDLRATRLVIPSLGIDAPVQPSYVIPDSSAPTPGCPPSPPGGETFTVPDRGIATPEAAIPGLEHKSWIFGHSRWQNVPGLFGRLEEINVGDQLLIDGTDRTTDTAINQQRFVVDALYLSDIESGGDLVFAPSREGSSLVILQTSARESGANKSWLLNRQTVMAKAHNVVVGNVDDPCKYLLLFVFARAS